MSVTVRILIYLSAKFLPNLTSLSRGFSLCPGPGENPRVTLTFCQIGKLMIAQHISDCAYLNPSKFSPQQLIPELVRRC